MLILVLNLVRLHKLIILGIDPGSHRIGYGVIKYENGKTDCVDYGVIELSEENQSQRLLALHKKLKTLTEKFIPDLAAVEKLFFFKNSKTAIQVAEARGVILLALEEAKVPVLEFTPLQVKNYISRYGRSQKSNLQKMIKLILGLDISPKLDDATDALALALCATTVKVMG